MLLHCCVFVCQAQQKTTYKSLKNILRVSDEPAYDDTSVQVFIFYAPDCPICQAIQPYLKQLHGQYKNSNVHFKVVIPHSLNYSRREIRTHEVLDSLQMNVYLDQKNQLIKRLDATVTPQAIVMLGTQKVVYSGPLNDLYVAIGQPNAKPLQHFLRDVLNLLQKKEHCEYQYIEPVGCFISP